MREAGMERVEEAKHDGRWERAYAGPAGMVVPEDFGGMLEREGNEKANEVWEGLGKSARYAVLHRVETASVKAREGVIERLVEGLREGRVPGVGGGEKKKAAGKTAAKTKVAKDGVEKKAPKKELLVKAKMVSTSSGKATAATDNSAQSRRSGLRARP